MHWSLLPPLSYVGAGTTLGGLREQAYDVGDDCLTAANNGIVAVVSNIRER